MDISLEKLGREYIPVTSWIDNVIALIPLQLIAVVYLKETTGKIV